MDRIDSRRGGEGRGRAGVRFVVNDAGIKPLGAAKCRKEMRFPFCVFATCATSLARTLLFQFAADEAVS